MDKRKLLKLHTWTKQICLWLHWCCRKNILKNINPLSLVLYTVMYNEKQMKTIYGLASDPISITNAPIILLMLYLIHISLHLQIYYNLYFLSNFAPFSATLRATISIIHRNFYFHTMDHCVKFFKRIRFTRTKVIVWKPHCLQTENNDIHEDNIAISLYNEFWIWIWI